MSTVAAVELRRCTPERTTDDQRAVQHRVGSPCAIWRPFAALFVTRRPSVDLPLDLGAVGPTGVRHPRCTLGKDAEVYDGVMDTQLLYDALNAGLCAGAERVHGIRRLLAPQISWI